VASVLPVITIDDPADPRLAMFRRNERGLSNRPQRRDDAGDGFFMAEGDLVVERALDAGCIPVLAMVDAARPPAVTARLEALIAVYAGTEALRAMATPLGVAYAVIAIFRRPARPGAAALAATSARLVLVEAVDNPVNIGSIARNAAGLGWHGLVLDTSSGDPLARRALRASMGHALLLPHARTTDLLATVLALRRDGFTVVALTPADDAVDLGEVARSQRMAVLVGSERSGLTAGASEAATLRARIPMAGGVDSLNVAAATAVACYALRQPT
jgi:tRNA G18 (ribose-2'-O)-methylase SpoU